MGRDCQEMVLPIRSVAAIFTGFMRADKTTLTLPTWISAGLLALLFWSTLYGIFQICWKDENYSHGLLLPFVTAYVFWEKRTRIKAAFATNNISKGWKIFLGMVLVGGVALLLIASVLQSLFLSWVAFFPILLASLALLCGKDALFAAGPALALNFMAKPIPDSFVPQLFGPFQVLAAHVSARVLELMNVPVFLMGNIIEIPSMRLMVEEACSGMRSLMSLITVSCIVLLLIEVPPILKLAIVLLSVVIALVLNVFRVALTGVLAHFVSPDMATGFFHTFSGLIVFIIGLFTLYGIGMWLNRIYKK